MARGRSAEGPPVRCHDGSGGGFDLYRHPSIDRANRSTSRFAVCPPVHRLFAKGEVDLSENAVFFTLQGPAPGGRAASRA